MKDIVIKFKNEEDKKRFKDLLESVIGIDIDGSSKEGFDNYGQLKYTSESEDEVYIESL